MLFYIVQIIMAIIGTLITMMFLDDQGCDNDLGWALVLNILLFASRLLWAPMTMIYFIWNISKCFMVYAHFKKEADKQYEKKEEIESKKRQKELEQFAYKFDREIQGYTMWKDIKDQYLICKGLINQLKSKKYKDIHDISNKKCEQLFLNVMSRIKVDYEEDRLSLCKDQILLTLKDLETTFKVELDKYEKHYNIQLNKDKKQMTNEYSKLREDINEQANLSEVYNNSPVPED